MKNKEKNQFCTQQGQGCRVEHTVDLSTVAYTAPLMLKFPYIKLKNTRVVYDKMFKCL